MTGRLSFHSKPDATTVPELPIITTWIRFIIGALYGISLGVRNETNGLTGVLFGLNVITFVPMVWFNSYLDANIESYKALNFVGVPNAFALMLLIWIAIFTMQHEEAESSLGKIISELSVSDATTITPGGEETFDSTVQSGMEDEF